METHDSDGVPYEQEAVTAPLPPYSEPGSLFDRTGLAFNRESYFR